MSTNNEVVDETVQEILEVISGADLEMLFLIHLKVNGISFPSTDNLMDVFEVLGYETLIPVGIKITAEQQRLVLKAISEVLNDKQVWHPLLNTLHKEHKITSHTLLRLL